MKIKTFETEMKTMKAKSILMKLQNVKQTAIEFFLKMKVRFLPAFLSSIPLYPYFLTEILDLKAMTRKK